MEYNVYGFELYSDNITFGEKEGFHDLRCILSKGLKEIFRINLDDSKYSTRDNELVLFKDGYNVVIESPVIVNAYNEVLEDVSIDVSVEGKNIIFTNNISDDYLNKYRHPVYLSINLRYESINEIEDAKEEKINHNNEQGDKEIDYDPVFNMESNELFVRKKMFVFIKRLLKHLGYKINHDEFKKVAYREKAIDQDEYFEIKNIYDAYIYITSDYKNPLTSYKLNKLIYLLTNKVVDVSELESIVNKINKGANIEEDIVKLFDSTSLVLEDKIGSKYAVIVKYMLMNYLYLYNGMTPLTLCENDYQALEGLNTKEERINHLISVKNRRLEQEATYYHDLKTLSFDDISSVILEEREKLNREYGINGVYIFGSFGKGLERIDSDIDILIVTSLDATGRQIQEGKEYIKTEYKKRFNRFVDVVEKIENEDGSLSFEGRKVF